MSKVLEFYKHILARLEDEKNESVKLSLDDVHSNNIFSLVVDGTEFGNLTRIFISQKKLRPFEVQLHTHRYPVNITAIIGSITQHTAEEVEELADSSAMRIAKYEYKSAITGEGSLSYLGEAHFLQYDSAMPPGSQMLFDTELYHSMSVSKGSIWIVEELGYESETSKVLGIPFKTKDLYNKPKCHKIDKMRKHVAEILKEIISQSAI